MNEPLQTAIDVFNWAVSNGDETVVQTLKDWVKDKARPEVLRGLVESFHIGLYLEEPTETTTTEESDGVLYGRYLYLYFIPEDVDPTEAPEQVRRHQAFFVLNAEGRIDCFVECTKEPN